MYHETTICGNLGNDPETRNVNGDVVCNFNVAVHDKWTDRNGEKRTRTTWFQVSVWGAEAAEPPQRFLSRGKQVLVVGKVSTNAYMKNGQPRASLRLRARIVRFLGGGEKSDNRSQQGGDGFAGGKNDDSWLSQSSTGSFGGDGWDGNSSWSGEKGADSWSDDKQGVGSNNDDDGADVPF